MGTTLLNLNKELMLLVMELMLLELLLLEDDSVIQVMYVIWKDMFSNSEFYILPVLLEVKKRNILVQRQ